MTRMSRHAPDEVIKETAVLRQTLADQKDHLDALTDQVNALLRGKGELRARLCELEHELARRQSLIEALQLGTGGKDHRLGELEGMVFGRDTEIALRDEEIVRLRAERDHLRAELEAVHSTRVWRLGTRYWRSRDQVKEWLRRAKA